MASLVNPLAVMSPQVTSPALKPPVVASLYTIVLNVFTLVAFDVTVNVALSDPAEPDRPLPDTAPVCT